MKIPVNLASRPFRKDRAVLLGSLMICAALVATLTVLVSLAMADRVQYADLRGELSRLNRRIQAVQAEQSKVDSVLRQPENAEVLERSVFLNSLLLRKGISWTRIFADLEKILPYNVKIVQIRPSVSGQTVSLDMALASEDPMPVIELLKAFGESKIFSNPVPQTEQAPSQSEPLYRFRITVDYAQKL
jgi:Tfp pilus assembly protein PilN